MKCNLNCIYKYIYTGKCELNPAIDWMECPSPTKKQELKLIGERWRKNKRWLEHDMSEFVLGMLVGGFLVIIGQTIYELYRWIKNKQGIFKRNIKGG